MSYWLSNVPLLLKSLRENGWYITAFPFSFNQKEYVVIFEDLREVDKNIKYFSASLTFVDYNDQNHKLETYVNAYTFRESSDILASFFGTDIDISNFKNGFVFNLSKALNKAMPNSYVAFPYQYKHFVLNKIEHRENNNAGYCCYTVRHNGKTSTGKQIFRSAINTAKTKILRPSLFKLIGSDKTISFCYRKDGEELADNDIILQLNN